MKWFYKSLGILAEMILDKNIYFDLKNINLEELYSLLYTWKYGIGCAK